MKRMLFGALLFIGGLLGALKMIDLAVSNPIVWNGNAGVQASLEYNGLTFPLVLFCILAVAGLLICYLDAYIKKELSKDKK